MCLRGELPGWGACNSRGAVIRAARMLCARFWPPLDAACRQPHAPAHPLDALGCCRRHVHAYERHHRVFKGKLDECAPVYM